MTLTFQRKAKEKLAREKRRRQFAGERIGEAKNPGPNYWRRPCWWGKDCQWRQEGKCQFWHAEEESGNSDGDAGNTAKWTEKTKEEVQEEGKEEAPWWAKQLMQDNARLSSQVERLSEDNMLLRQQVGDLAQVVSQLWESDIEIRKCVEDMEKGMETHALDTDDDIKEEEEKEDAGNSAEDAKNAADDASVSSHDSWLAPRSAENSSSDEDDILKEAAKLDKMEEKYEKAKQQPGAFELFPGFVLTPNGAGNSVQAASSSSCSSKVQIKEGVFDPDFFEPPPGWKDRKSKGKGKSAHARSGNARKVR